MSGRVPPGEIKVSDGGQVDLSTFGPRRLMALLALAQRPELDDVSFSAELRLTFFDGRRVKAQLIEIAREITLPKGRREG